MDYSLCSSSSTEEGEISKSSFDSIPNSEFPRSFSILKNWYPPDSQFLIGSNSIPRPSDYPKNLPRTRLKKRLRKDLPDLFNVISLNKDRNFFNNKFEKCDWCSGGDCEEGSRVKEGKGIKGNLIPFNFKPLETPLEPPSLTPSILHLDSSSPTLPSKSLYSSFCDIFSFDDKRHEVVQNVNLYPFCSRFILIRDSIIDKLNLENVFNFFRVIRSRKGISYVFEDSFNRKINFNEYLELYYEEILRSKGSNGIRSYLCKSKGRGKCELEGREVDGSKCTGRNEDGSKIDENENKDKDENDNEDYDTFLAIYSSTTFLPPTSLTSSSTSSPLLHFYNGLDYDKNFMIFFNKNEIDFKTIKIKNESKSKIDFILNLDLEEGDYAISKGEVYKVGIKGEKHEYEGLILEEFE